MNNSDSSIADEEMRQKRIPWLTNFPCHWGIERAKWLFQKMDRPVRPDDEVVTAFRDGQVTLRKNRRVDGFTESLQEIGYQGVRTGDLVVHAMDAFAGAIGVSDSDGKATPVYLVCTSKADLNVRFYAHLLREMARRQFILALARGVRERSTDFRYSEFASLWLPIPPRSEQDNIVAFLGETLSNIDRYIVTKQRLLALLREQKQAIIHQAVTRGLDASVPLKPSGVAWLGEVPAHWEVKALKYAFHSMDYGISATATDRGTIPLLTMGNIKDGKVAVPDNGGVESVDEHYLLQDGDLLYNRTNSAELVGKVGLFRDDKRSKVTFASYLVRLKPLAENDSAYLNYLLNSPTILGVARQLAVPSLHQSNLNPTRYGRIQVAIPPVSEQRQIVDYLQGATTDLERAIAATEQQINFIREYRTRLIADVVTGKVDVRAVAVALPAEVGEDAENFEDDIIGETQVEDLGEVNE